MLFIAPVLADEGTAGENRSKPIPIAKLKRPAQVDFDREVLPILKNNCLACHNKTTAKAKLVLETPEDMIKGGDSGPVVTPKKSGASLLLKAAAHQLEDTVMPPPGNKVQASNLTPDELGLIKLWIDQGAKGSAGIVRPIEWQPLPEGLNPIYAVAVTADGQFAACARANQIFIYHLPSRKLVERLTDPQLQKAGLYARPGVAHRDIVHSLAFSPDGSLLASGAYREAKLWRRPKNMERLRLASVARRSVTALATSPDGRWLATGGDDGRVQVRELADGKRVKHLPALKGTIRCLKFSPDGTKFGSVSDDRLLRICDVPAGRIVAQARLDSEPSALVWLSDDQLASGGADNLIHLWHLDAAGRSLAATRELRGNEGTITALDVVPSSRQIISGSSDGSLRLWDAGSGKLIHEMKQNGPVTAVAARNDGKRIASAGTDKTAKLWDFADDRQIAELKGDRYAQEHAADCERALVFAKSEAEFHKTELKSAETNQTAQAERVKKAAETSENAEKALVEKQRNFLEATEARAAAEKSLEDLQAETRKAAQSLAAAEAAAKEGEAEAKSARETPGQTRETIERLSAEAAAKSKAVAGAKTAFEKLSAASREKEGKANEHLKTATKAFTEAEKELKKAEQAGSNARTELQLANKAADEAGRNLTDARMEIQKAGDQQKQREVDLQAAKGAVVESEQPIRCLAFSPDDLTLAAGGDDGLIHTWSADNGAAFETFRGHKNAVLTIAFATNGNLVSGAADRDTVVWDLKAAWKLERVIGTGDVNSPIIDRVNIVRFSPDGNLLATGGGEPTRGGEIRLWQTRTGRLTQSFTNVHSDAVFGLDFSPDGNYLASGAADKFARVIDLSTGKIVRQFEGHTHHVLGVSWERNERTLATAGADNVIKVWDFTKGERKKNIGGFDKEVTSITFVGYTDQALAASGDGKVRLVRENGSEVRSFSGDNDFVESAAVTPDGKIVLAGGQDGTLRVWDGTDGKLIVSFPPPDAGR